MNASVSPPTVRVDVLDAPASAPAGVRIAGVVGPQVNLAEVLTRATGRDVVVDLFDVQRFNSYGVRSWIRWVAALEQRGNHVHLSGCSIATVMQLNLIQDFIGASGQVLSVMAPYTCPQCERPHQVELDMRPLRHPVTPPTLPCPHCAATLAFDDLPDAYFAFMEDGRAAQPRPDLDERVHHLKALRSA